MRKKDIIEKIEDLRDQLNDFLKKVSSQDEEKIERVEDFEKSRQDQ